MRSLTIFLLLLALSACGNGGSNGAPTPSPAAEPATLAAEPATPVAEPATPTAQAEEGEILVTLQQEGGFAGIATIVTVDTGGVMRVTQGEPGQAGGGPQELRLTPEQLQQLIGLLESPEFQTLEPEYISSTCADCFNYTLSVKRGPRLQIIRTDDASDSNRPAVLSAVLELLAQVQIGQ